MLKSDHNIISRFIFNKSRRKVRTDSNWTDYYPSPEPSFMKKAAERTCDWVYNNIDIFFQGSSKRNVVEENNCLNCKSGQNFGYSQEWDLNQGVVDIALKDIKGSLSWLLPGFISQFAIQLQQRLLLYFFTDYIVEDESSDKNYLNILDPDQAFLDKGKIIYFNQEFKAGINSKLLPISQWLLNLFHQLGLFLRLEHQKKTYCLLGSFAPQEYDYSIDNQNCMIRGPDKTNLNPVRSFHKKN